MTGDLAKAVMVPWDRRFVEKLEKLSVNQKLYCRYVDDQNIVVEVLSPGSRYNREEDKIEIMEEMVENDREVPGDKRTFEVVREVGDSLEEMIRLTADVPSNYPGGRVPILDMEVWVERDESGMSKIRWGFYEKKMKSKYVMMKDSAVGMKTKW